MLKVKCREYEGSLLLIESDVKAVYPNGETEVKTYRVEMGTYMGDLITCNNVQPNDITIWNDEY